MIKIYVTKYWQTLGVVEREVERIEAGGYVRVLSPIFDHHYLTLSRRDYFLRRDHAVNDCARRRDKKVKTMMEQISRLEGKKYD